MQNEELTLVKLTKEEKDRQKVEAKRAKQEAYEKIPVKDRERKKKYQIAIYKTLVVFVLSLIVLGTMAAGVLDVKVGLVCLIILVAISTMISRGNK